MVWVLIFGGIAVAALVLLVSYGVWLWHKVSDLLSELEVLGTQLEQVATLVASVQIPESLGDEW